MEFISNLKQFSKRIDSLKQNITTEESTKTSLIMPFFQILGYEIFNPSEFIPEYTTDVGIKKGERVDYAIKIEHQIVMLIEAKPVFDNLEKHTSQLFRYFTVSKAKFAILTNGIVYKFYTDLDESNKMDKKPFLVIDLENLSDSDFNELKKFTKPNFDIENIFNSAEELKYSNEIKTLMKAQLDNPTNSFINYILNEIYNGRKTQNVIDKFKPIIKKSLNQFINELINEKIKVAFEKEEETDEEVAITIEEVKNKIITTEEELEGFYIIKSILRNHIDISKLSYKDTESYFGILYDNNIRKWICRLNLNSSKTTLELNYDINNRQKATIESLDNLYNYSNEIIKIAKSYENQ